MSNIEDRLLKEQARLSELSAPEDMEARLRQVLNAAVPRRKAIGNIKNSWKIAAAVLVAVMLFAGNQYHALAYYGKILLGFDGVVNGTLSELSEQGKGQALDEQVKLADGTVLTINGIMSDENQFILYYTLSHPNGLANEDWNRFLPIRIKGFRTDSNIQSGASNPSKDRTETKGMATFEPVSPLAKKLTLDYWEELSKRDQRQEGHLTFPYHPDEAMPTKIKQSINETLSVNDTSITFGSITATPTMTLIEGTFPAEYAKQFSQVLNGVELLANGKPVAQLRNEFHLSQNGYAFTIRYDSLPENLQSTQLVLNEYGQKVEIPIK